MQNMASLLPAASLVPFAETPAQGHQALGSAVHPAAEPEDTHEPPQQAPPPTVFTERFDEIEDMAGKDGTVQTLTRMADQIAEADNPGLPVAVVDLTRSPIAGMVGVSLTDSSSSSTSSSETESPSADPAAPAAATALAVAKAAAMRARTDLADITEGREAVPHMQELD